MNQKTAILLDTCYIQRRITLDDILNDKDQDYFITDKIIAELEKCNRTKGKEYDHKRQKIEQYCEKMSETVSDTEYQNIAEFVEIFEKDQDLNHNSKIIRLLYEAQKTLLQINFTKNRSILKKWFSNLRDTYKPIFDICDMEMEVSDNNAVIYKKGAKEKPRVVKVESKGELLENFAEYPQLSQIEDRYKLELAMLNHKYEDILNARDILIYFIKNPGKIIEHSPTNKKTSDFGKLTAKSMAKTIYESNGYNETGLTKQDIPYFISEVNNALVEVFSKSPYNKSDWTSILARTVAQTENYIKRRINENGGYIPDNNTDTDANLVDAARNFKNIMPGYDNVKILTSDWDVGIIVKLVNNYNKPVGITLSCNLNE